MNINNEELEAFLIEADLINEKVKALAENRMSPEEFDHLERLREQDRKRRENAKLRKEQEALEKKKQGYEGKGIGKDFKNFCYFCRWEYPLETPDCLKCKKRTMTLEQRQTQLETMVNAYKERKKNREERKHRWDMWQKTQQSLWKKNSTNYSKWEYFVSDSEEEPDKEPILPKNDPNFMALEADLEERKKRKQKDHEEANKLKEKGNKLMKESNHEEAMHKYTLALEHAKDIKSIYTNRALAFIKLGKFKKAIKDCTNVIEYMEIFEKIGENKDLTFKAYSRRAMARKEIKDYKEGLQDIKEALKLYPDDKNGLLLKKELEGLSEHAEKVEKLLRENSKPNPEKISPSDSSKINNMAEKEEEAEEILKEEFDEESIKKQEKEIIKELAEQAAAQEVEKNDTAPKEKKSEETIDHKKIEDKKSNEAVEKIIETNPIEKIKENIQNLTAENIKSTFDMLIKNKDMITIFIAAKGIEACLKQLLNSEFSNQEVLLISLCLEGNGVGEKSVWDFGIEKIHNKITEILNNPNNQKYHALQICEDLFEILVPISLYEPFRIKLSNDEKVHKFVETTYTKLLAKRNTTTQLLNVFIIYMSNLLSGNDSGLKVNYFTKQKTNTLVDSFFVMILGQKTQNKSFLDLKRNVYGLLANLATNPEHRKNLIEYFERNNKFTEITNELQNYPRKMPNFIEYIESILSLLVNLTFDSSLEIKELSNLLFERFVKGRKLMSKEICYRSLLIISRLKISNPEEASKWLETFQEISLEEDPLQNPIEKSNMTQVVKILNSVYTPNNGKVLTSDLPSKLFDTLSKYISDNLVHENLFCNTSNLFGVIAMSANQNLKEKVCCLVASNMKRLVFISKDKVGNWRKNAAILIAKCSSNPKCREAMEKEHAMDVLKSIAHLVAGK